MGAGLLVCLLLITLAAVYAVRLTAESERSVTTVHANSLVEAERLALSFEQKVAASRAFLLSAEPVFLGRMQQSREEFYRGHAYLTSSSKTEEAQKLLAVIASEERNHQSEMERMIQLRQEGRPVQEVTRFWSGRVQPLRDALRTEFERLVALQRDMLARAEQEARRSSTRVITLLILIATIVVVVGSVSYLLAARALFKGLRREADLRMTTAEGEQRLSALIDSAMDAIVSVDADQRVIIFNRAAERIFGWSAAEVTGKPLDLLIPQRYREAHRQHVSRFGETGASSRTMQSPGTLYGLRSNGEEFPIEATIAHTAVGGEKIYTVILRDITQRLYSEAALIRNEKLATAGLMAGTIAHEINNPLESLSGAVYLLKNETLGDNAARLIDVLEQEVARLTRIAQQTLGFYRETPEAIPVNIRRVLDDIIAFYRRKLEAKQTAVEFGGDASAEILGFPGELRQVFSNLIINAVDAMPVGGKLSVSIAATNGASPGVCVQVRDNGKGIPPHIAERMFQPFFSTKHEKGTGLGLWVSKALVEKHGGNIVFTSSTSDHDHGTTFAVFLPKVPPRHPAQSRRAP